MAETNPLTNEWFHSSKDKQQTYSCGLQDLRFGGEVWIRDSIALRFKMQIASKARWGLGEMVVLCLMESLLRKVNYYVFMGNYFTLF